MPFLEVLKQLLNTILKYFSVNVEYTNMIFGAFFGVVLFIFIFRQFVKVFYRPHFEKLLDTKDRRLIDKIILNTGSFLFIEIFVFFYAFLFRNIFINSSIYKFIMIISVIIMTLSFISIWIHIAFMKLLKSLRKPYRTKKWNQKAVKLLSNLFLFSSIVLIFGFAITTWELINSSQVSEIFMLSLLFPFMTFYTLHIYLLFTNIKTNYNFLVKRVPVEQLNNVQLFYQYKYDIYLIFSTDINDKEQREFYAYNTTQDTYLHFIRTTSYEF